MRRINDKQYDVIEQLEQIVTETWPDAELYQYGLFVDTWQPSTGAIRVAIIDGQSLMGSIDGQWYSVEVAAYEIETDGRITNEDLAAEHDSFGYSTIQQIAAALAAGTAEGN